MHNPAEINRITGIILHESIRVHNELGPGLLESTYEAVLAKRLRDRGLKVERQRPMPLVLDGEDFGEAYRLDLFVNDMVVVDLKAVEQMHPVSFRQVRSYLRLLELPIGLLINFGDVTLMDGYHRIANNFIE